MPVAVTQLARSLDSSPDPSRIDEEYQHQHWERTLLHKYTEDDNPGLVNEAFWETMSLSNAFNYIPGLELDDQIIHCWAGISNFMDPGNKKLFRSRKHTTAIISTNNCTALLKEIQPLLKNWYRESKSLN
ncbi:hypothetical protein CONLIGDRAFT_667387 [Coniochaeta ligniaria NRRL 30616]|uniref:Uncharacterized protein n=1 Tax=Coniochaeta ligniaria NRRL 30616 TaxID=1408157 RepID=A0A1J7J361_9PEZI|nr:hypothetical protein CONLIGDRAFT_667387 [Coniochaeta ligniaria NRRL 30616]